MILWELATRKRPWDHIVEDKYIRFYAVLCSALEAGQRPEIPKDVTLTQSHFVQIMERCWATEPASRPAFDVVLRDFGTA